VDENWYLGENMNGEQLGKFRLQRMTTSWNICKSLRRVTFLTHPVYAVLTLYKCECIVAGVLMCRYCM